MYFIAFVVLSDIDIQLLSCFPQVSHLNPLSLRLKYRKFSFCLQFIHSVIRGVNPNIHNNFILNVLSINSGSLSVSESVYNVFKK